MCPPCPHFWLFAQKRVSASRPRLRKTRYTTSQQYNTPLSTDCPHFWLLAQKRVTASGPNDYTRLVKLLLNSITPPCPQIVRIFRIFHHRDTGRD